MTLTLVVSNQKLSTNAMPLPPGGCFLLTEVFFPIHADSSFVGGNDMSPEVHCNLCNHCYTLGMPGPRPDIRCVQYLPTVHYKVPNKFLVPSGTSDIIDWHQRSKTLLNVEQRSTTSLMPDMDPPHHMMLKGNLQALLQMYILMEEHQKYIIRMYQHL